VLVWYRTLLFLPRKLAFLSTTMAMGLVSGQSGGRGSSQTF